MATISETGNPSNSLIKPGLLMDEFLPIVRYKEPSKQENVPENSELKPSDEKITLYKNIASKNREFNILELTTTSKNIKLPFTIKKGSEDSDDDDGIIMVDLSDEDGVSIKSNKEFTAKYNTEFTLELEFSLEETKEFYVDFHAKDDTEDEWNIGELKNVHCGRVKIIFKTPNEWEFNKEKIDEIKKYAIANRNKSSGATKYSDYHHCTDTHKHITYKLLDDDNLDLGKDQVVSRDTPKAYEKVGESTTKGVRDKLIAATYAEPSKVFTVVDVNNKEVLTSNGQPGNTDNAIKGFKESPIDYMKSKCPSNGYYVFIGAYNSDYHSFTIIVKKEEINFSFQFVDQIKGVSTKTGKELESWFLAYIEGWKQNFPMYLRLYQLRNKKK